MDACHLYNDPQFLEGRQPNFRNLKNDSINLAFKEVYFAGENGQGKSNLLEALYYSAYGSSFRTHIDSQIIKYGQQNFSISSFYTNSSESTQQIRVIYDKGKKQIEKNGKKIHDRKELINTIPCVLFCHNDMRFATGEPEHRRFFCITTRNFWRVVNLKSAMIEHTSVSYLFTTKILLSYPII